MCPMLPFMALQKLCFSPLNSTASSYTGQEVIDIYNYANINIMTTQLFCISLCNGHRVPDRYTSVIKDS